MPVYDYECRDCGPFSQLRSIHESSATTKCPDCGLPSSKVFPVVHLRAMSVQNRLAWQRNERSAHAPHVCSATCSHKQSRKATRLDGKPELTASKKKNSRPWMLGH